MKLKSLAIGSVIALSTIVAPFGSAAMAKGVPTVSGECNVIEPGWFGGVSNRNTHCVFKMTNERNHQATLKVGGKTYYFTSADFHDPIMRDRDGNLWKFRETQNPVTGTWHDGGLEISRQDGTVVVHILPGTAVASYT